MLNVLYIVIIFTIKKKVYKFFVSKSNIGNEIMEFKSDNY